MRLVQIKPKAAGVEAAAVYIPLAVDGGRCGGIPITFGVPVPPGELAGVGRSALVLRRGGRIPVQARITGRWPDGSVRWVLVDGTLPELGVDDGTGLSLELAAGGHEPSAERLVVRQTAKAVEVGSGPWHFQIPRIGDCFLEAGLKSEALGRAEVRLLDRTGRRQTCRFRQATVECEGPERVIVQWEGSFGRRCPLRVALRLTFHAGRPLVGLDATVHNPRPARHHGGIWDLGDSAAYLFRELAVVLQMPPCHEWRAECRPARKVPISVGHSRLTVYQDSSGGENWNSANHVNRQGHVPSRFRGYRLATESGESAGLRAEPTLTVRGGQATWHVAVPEFWQQFPKCLATDGREVRVALFPAEFGDLHELQGGERKTHTVWFGLDSGLVSGQGTVHNGRRLDWVFNRPVLRPRVDWSMACGLLPEVRMAPAEAVGRLDQYLAECLDVLLANRERVDEYGWRNFGEIFADHEQQYYEGAEPLISHYNNQFDMVQGFLLQFLRTGDERWWKLGDPLARHVMDIDVYHTQRDRAAYNGGLFWFTDHYLHAKTSTHRTYSRHNAPEGGPYGGGPSAEHNFTSGLLLYHRLSGSADAKAAVVGLADWVIARDDGHRTILGVVDDGPTGLATASGDREYHGPGRAGGNSVNALLDAWTVTADPRYLEYAERLIRRCVHPQDDVDALQLLDVEKRWSYTVFLTALLKYLRLKAEAEQLDESYAYARAALLHYAGWMLQHEKPYFDQREKLEYPTEAWAAQEFRKANVLRLAAAHADEPLATAFWERGRELADRAWSDLLGFETRTTARALAILLVEGLSDLGLRAGRPERAPRGPAIKTFPPRVDFVPQRFRVKAMLKSPRGIPQIAMRAGNPFRWVRYMKSRWGGR